MPSKACLQDGKDAALHAMDLIKQVKSEHPDLNTMVADAKAIVGDVKSAMTDCRSSDATEIIFEDKKAKYNNIMKCVHDIKDLLGAAKDLVK